MNKGLLFTTKGVSIGKILFLLKAHNYGNFFNIILIREKYLFIYSNRANSVGVT